MTKHASRFTFHVLRFTFHVSRINWSLLFGGLLVALIALVALIGPQVAPRDPLQENAIIRVGEKWRIPPFPAFTPGFVLGSDHFGRDLFSRLLWAVRPTMTMVVTVALVRLALGVAIGIGAGWFTGWTGRAIDAVIGAALSVPALMVALGAIAAVGIETGVWAFVVGLSINGWVETARLVREQTRIVKGQLYVEAARALGSSDTQVILRHVLRQIMPMVWMLFAFEISGTLMVTAALGFLGYYIGGDVWVVVSDTAARAISGAPELGQMLATSWVRIDEPWAMIVVGSVVFVTVLGFNLMGRGLRRRLAVKQLAKRTWLVRAREALSEQVTRPAGDWVYERVWAPLARRQKPRYLYPTLAALCMLTVGGVVAWRWQTVEQAQKEVVASAFPQGQPWSAERRDPQGTLWNISNEPISPQVQWKFADPSGFAGGPAVSAQGSVFIVSQAGTLYALDPAGSVRWQAALPGGGAGTPALSDDGQVYVTDEAGNLSAFAPDGALVWRFQAEAGDFATSGPIAGPNGALYFMVRGGTVQAVSPAGEGLWRTRVTSDPLYSPPRLSADGRWLFVKNVALSAQDGAVQTWQAELGVDDQYLTGADGQDYLRLGNEIWQWQLVGDGVQTGASATWDYRQFTVRAEGGPTDAGVTPDQLVWMLYSSNLEDTRIVWIRLGGPTLGNLHLSQRETKIIALDQDATTYTCGWGHGIGMLCMALKPGADDPLWQVALEQGENVAGGALVPGRLYAAMDEGFLYAIGQGQPDQLAEQMANSAQGVNKPLGPEIPANATGEVTAPPPAQVAWAFTDPAWNGDATNAGFVSLPAVAADGTVYIAAENGTFYALHPAGHILWQAALPAAPVGSPAVSATGEVYQADKGGHLSAFAPDGALRWRYTPPESKPSIVGPLVGPDGTIFHTVGTSVQALSADGQALWQTRAKTFRTLLPLQLSREEGLLFWADDAFQVQDGTLLELESPVNADQYVVGKDGQLYLRDDHTVMQWRRNGTTVGIVQSAQWNYTQFASGQQPPDNVGVTAKGTIWVLYSEWRNTGLVWLDPTGQVLGALRSTLAGGQLVKVLDQDATALVCGVGNAGATRGSYLCAAFTPNSEDAVWQVTLEREENMPRFDAVRGGVLAPGRLYVVMEGGVLFAVGEQVSAPAPTPAEAQPVVETPVAEPSPAVTPAPTALPADSVVVAGELATFTLPIINHGPSDAPGVVVTDVLPAGLSLVSATASQGLGCQVGQVGQADSLSYSVTCFLGDVPGGASATITLVVAVDVSAMGVITHSAAVVAQAADPDMADNQVTRPVNVRGAIDLALRQSVAPTPAIAGASFTATLTITNHGPGNASGVSLLGALPLSTTLAAASGCQIERVVGQSFACVLGELPAGGGAIVVWRIALHPSLTGSVLYTVAVVANETELNLLDNTIEEQIIVTTEADVSITR
jgi:uncharacterized repeat protein (TIGR01451 family)